ncbi:MAG TPA: dihydrodipicolinate synthase family protein, partial [Niabella sp.]|nr:dihydrodipicolinate synthase family protein [Niabella sp.]
EMPNFVGIKDTVDTLSHTRAIIREVKAIRPDFQVLSGFDEYCIPNLLSGGSGVISGLNNIVPQLFVQAIDALNDGHLEKVAEIQQLIGKYSSIYTIGEDFVTTIKTVVSRKFGYMTPASRSNGAALSRQACMETDALFGTQYEFNNAIIPTVV